MAVVAGLSGLLGQIAAPTPVLVIGVDPAGSLSRALIAVGWSIVQVSVLVARATSLELEDDAAGPGACGLA